MSFKIQTLNKIASVGLNQLDRDNYEIASEINNPDAILVRSAEMHDMQLSDNVKAVARAGAGTNNIPKVLTIFQFQSSQKRALLYSTLLVLTQML